MCVWRGGVAEPLFHLPGLQRGTPVAHYPVINPNIKHQPSLNYFTCLCVCLAASWPAVFYSVLRHVSFRNFICSSPASLRPACLQPTQQLVLCVWLLTYLFIFGPLKDFIFTIPLYLNLNTLVQSTVFENVLFSVKYSCNWGPTLITFFDCCGTFATVHYLPVDQTW